MSKEPKVQVSDVSTATQDTVDQTTPKAKVDQINLGVQIEILKNQCETLKALSFIIQTLVGDVEFAMNLNKNARETSELLETLRGYQV